MQACSFQGGIEQRFAFFVFVFGEFTIRIAFFAANQ